MRSNGNKIKGRTISDPAFILLPLLPVTVRSSLNLPAHFRFAGLSLLVKVKNCFNTLRTIHSYGAGACTRASACPFHKIIFATR